MLFKVFLQFFQGYIKIQVEGYYIEKFLNKCVNQGILIWGLKHKKTTLIEAKIGISDYKKIKEIASNNGCIVTKLKEKGVPIIIKKYKKRKGLLLGILTIFIAIFILSKYIWKIDIEGNETINKNEILDLVEKDGLKVGTKKSKINTSKIINQVRMERTDIAWIGIEFKGTNAIVKIVESIKKPNIIDEKYFCNIVATKDAEITNIVVQNGTAQVEVGNTVKKGDILIAGWIQGEHTEKYFVNSAGEVKGKVQYSQTEKIIKKEIEKTRTGKVEKKYSIKINNFVINLYKKFSKFKKYDTIVAEKNLKLFKNLYLPVTIIKNSNYEVNENEKINDYETAKNIGELTAKSKLNKLNFEKLLESNTEVTEKEDCYEVKVTYQVIEEIGTKEKI